ncbi:hypothetical protein GWI33_018000 [Rhynchophorus ferrugineus]|uniref:Uncharacterized protein n=1 Tax=Rhynchophorus ferrugineus TaxID=354439 RepID=A0A834HXE6_RHYFE|nr:hypothetical protein GWI33_018000 [Rhynchophorus ferrugineus]
MTLNLGLRLDFPWSFVIADVSRPIIGVDFIVHYDFLVDLQNRKLLDRNTRMSVNERHPQYENIASIKLINNSSRYHDILQKFPEILDPSV